MNRLEMIYQDDYIEIYFKTDLLTTEYYMTNSNKVLARCHATAYNYYFIEVKSIRYDYLRKFNEVITEHMIKAL